MHEHTAGLLSGPAEATIRIGVTGHHDLTAASHPLVAAALREELRAYLPFVGVSCLAPGADQIFARVALELGADLEVVLPASDYRSRCIGAARAEFDALVAAARAFRTTGLPTSGRPAYARANDMMLAEIDRLIAVWDGRPPTRLGSTGHVVAAAARLGIPTTIVWPPTSARTVPPAQERPHPLAQEETYHSGDGARLWVANTHVAGDQRGPPR